MTIEDFIARCRVFVAVLPVTVVSADGALRARVVRVGHHGPTTDDHPVELFVGDVGPGSDALIAELSTFPGDRQLRVAVPVPDADHHRMLSILGLAVGEGPSLEIQTEPMDSLHMTIRANAPE